jgi:hypothetical protein
MRFMVMVKANKDYEAGLPPKPELLAAIGKLSQDMVKAGVLLESAELQRLHAEREAVRADIGGAVAAALVRADAALAQVTAYNRDILPLTRQDEAFAQDAYQSGQTGIDALILALQRSRDRRMAGLQSLLDYYLALADLERAIRGPVR